MQELKSGVAVLASKYPQVPVVPVFMHGLGKSMPKGTFIPVPFFVDVYIGARASAPYDGLGQKLESYY